VPRAQGRHEGSIDGSLVRLGGAVGQRTPQQLLVPALHIPDQALAKSIKVRGAGLQTHGQPLDGIGKLTVLRPADGMQLPAVQFVEHHHDHQLGREGPLPHTEIAAPQFVEVETQHQRADAAGQMVGRQCPV